MAETGGPSGRTMKYPYSVLGKALHFPWKHYWQNGRGFRFIVISIFLTIPVIYPIHKFVNSPMNVQMWQDIRKKRQHDPFAPPSEHH